MCFVDTAQLSKYWPACEPLVARGLTPAEGEADSSHLLADLQAGRSYLIAVIDDDGVTQIALVVQFLAYPNYKIAHVYSIGGRGVIESTQHWATIKDWMRQHGAVKVQGVCKPSRARLWQKLGFTDAYHVVRQDL